MPKDKTKKVNKKIQKLMAAWEPPTNKEWCEDLNPLISLRIASEILRKNSSEMGVLIQNFHKDDTLDYTADMLSQSRDNFAVLSAVCDSALDRLKR